MADPTTQNKTTDEPIAPPPGWRFRLRVIFFALGLISPVGAAIVALTNLSTALKATLSGLFLAVACMGKAGFAYVKSRLRALLHRYGPPKEAGRVRHYIGLVMLILPGIYAWVLMYTSLD
jgi:hypothetical protein